MADTEKKKKENKVIGSINKFYGKAFDRINEENEQERLEFKYRKCDTEIYRKYGLAFKATGIGGVVCLLLSFATGGVDNRWIPYVLLVVALSLFVVACYIQFVPMHNERMRYATEMEARRKKAEKKAARAKRR